ncbi:MAG: glycosyltransferase family 2 protein [Rhodospirillales bacterium]|nr:glycosyltransferase family 2 protein [Rhodospirillales bacterium]
MSAVIPTYNRGSVIGRAIASVRAQTYPAIEIIVVDDGSTDDTPARLEGLAGPSLKVFHTAVNGGASAARNRGIAEARGELIAFLDADDEWLPDKTARQVARFAELPENVGVVYCGIREMSAAWPPIDRPPRHRGDLFETLRVVNVLRTSGVMVRRPVFDAIGGFDTALPARHDWDLWLRIARRYAVDFIPDVGVHYHFGAADQLSYRARTVFLANARIHKRYNRAAPSRRALGAHLALQSRELLALGRRRLAARYALGGLMRLPSHPVSRWVLKRLLEDRLRGAKAAVARLARPRLLR